MVCFVFNNQIDLMKAKATEGRSHRNIRHKRKGMKNSEQNTTIEKSIQL